MSTSSSSPTRENDNTFYLGLTMAGAISAGCYSGGVLDYLFEILELWEKAKSGEDIGLNPEFQKRVPQYNVVIDTIGGASAGGMTAAMAGVHALRANKNPVTTTTNPDRPKNNIFYDSWVLMDDDSGENGSKKNTFSKLWELDDLKDKNVNSLLNSKIVDAIADRAFAGEGDIRKAHAELPPYIAKDLQVLLSLCSLRGVPLDVDFSAPGKHESLLMDNPKHTTWEHFIIAHFKLSPTYNKQTSQHLWFNPFDEEYKNTLKKSTIATGAFPVGLMPRHFSNDDLSDHYIKSIVNRVVFRDFSPDKENVDELKHSLIHKIQSVKSIDARLSLELIELVNRLPQTRRAFIKSLSRIRNHYDLKQEILNDLEPLGHSIDFQYMPEPFSFTAIDGGTINNEPYGEVLEILKHKYDRKQPGAAKNYGVVMIDPFPDRSNKDDHFITRDSLLKTVPLIINTLKNQARVKRLEMLEGFSDSNIRGVIYPKKWKTHRDTYAWPIASESFNAFGGFVDIKFRQHDFFLGRNNARNFFRYVFTLEYDPENGRVHPIHKNWTKEMIDTFAIEYPKDTGKKYLPIIPDMNLLLRIQNHGKAEEKNDYDVAEMPKVDYKRITDEFKFINARVNAILTGFQKEMLAPVDKDKPSETPLADKIHQELFGQSKLSRLWSKMTMKSGQWVLKIIIGNVSKRISKKIISYILKDLEKKNLLKKE